LTIIVDASDAGNFAKRALAQTLRWVKLSASTLG
jgi:hypothetical protein